jgi:5-oxoprolinase (ATP-hydrolysing) subunit A
MFDLNCDMGEGCGNDAELMNYVSSVNIACGFHAGNASIMRETVELTVNKQVNIGAHPSFLDLANFGRNEIHISPQEVFDIVLYQTSALKGICEAFGTKLHHVKPHGALYNQAAKDVNLAEAIANAVKKIDANLILYGLSGSYLISEAEKIGLRTKSEVFADRTYQSDGSLTPRTMPNALIMNLDEMLKQVLQMIEKQTVTATNGDIVTLKAETICIHGDGENAVEFAKAIRNSCNL